MNTPHLYSRTTLVCLVIANMIGAGVYTTSGFTLAALHTPQRVLLAWAIAGLIALAGARSYGMLIRAMPESGGEYLFLARAAHPMLGFIAGWVSLIAGFTGSIAFAASAFSEYMQPVVPSIPANGIAIFVIVLAALSHAFRPHWGSGLQNSFVIIKVALLLGFLAFGWHHFPDRSSYLPVEMPPASVPTQLGAFAQSLMWISLSYLGFNAAVYIAEETHQPHRRIGRALIIGTLIVTILYLLLNALFVFAPPPDSIAGEPAVAAIAAEVLGGPRLALFVRIIIGISLFTSVLSMMLAAPRVYAKMAEDGWMPPQLKATAKHPKKAIWTQAALACALVATTGLRELLGYLGLTLSLCAAMSVACLFTPGVRKALPLSRAHIAPGFYLLATIVTAVALAHHDIHQLSATLLTFACGGVVYGLIKWKS